MSKVYAQLNNNNVCIGVSKLSATSSKPSMVELQIMDVSVLGKKYNNGVWEEVEEPAQALSEVEQTQLELALNVEYLICLMELND